VPSIQRIHWADLGAHRYEGRAGQLHVVWPSPVDHDACFAAAGFNKFADSDDVWDADFLAALERLVVEPCFAAFGTPARAIVCTSDGHALLWVWLAAGAKAGWGRLLDVLRADKPCGEMTLVWSHLGPPEVFAPEH
jgi:hypothetical protein